MDIHPLTYSPGRSGRRLGRALVYLLLAVVAALPYGLPDSNGIGRSIQLGKSTHLGLGGDNVVLRVTCSRITPAPPGAKYYQGMSANMLFVPSPWYGYIPLYEHDSEINRNYTRPPILQDSPLIEWSLYRVSLPWYVFSVVFILFAARAYWRRPEAIIEPAKTASPGQESPASHADDLRPRL